MSANVETMMSVREVPWHGLGEIVQEAPTSKDALELAGLNWNVNSNPIYDVNGNEIKGFKANTRDSDGSVLGVVTNRYKIVQNFEAFDFTDALLGEGVTYETAGSLKNGKVIWLLAKMPERKILGDKFDPYICFTNSHDGTGAIRVISTPIRVVCNNTLNLALNTANRSWSTKHMGDMNSKLQEAKHTLQLANDYLDCLSESAEKLAEAKFMPEDVNMVLDEMFPKNDEMSERKKNNIDTVKSGIIACMLAPDLVQFMNTKWGFLNAVSDYITHANPARLTDSYAENNWGRIMNGHPIMDRAMALVGVES